MADELEKVELWLPSEFLTDDDIVMAQGSYKKKAGFGFEYSSESDSTLCFPSEFPYDFGFPGSLSSSPVLSSPVDSVVGSTETESDEEDLISGLTHHLTRSALIDSNKASSTPSNDEKRFPMSGSPQSTLTQLGTWSSGRTIASGNGSPNGASRFSSPPTSPLGISNDSWDLIYQAAGRVARLKMNNIDGTTKYTGIPGPPPSFTTTHPINPAEDPKLSFYRSHIQQARMNQQRSGMWNKEIEDAWLVEQLISQNTGLRRVAEPRNCLGNERWKEMSMSSHSEWALRHLNHQHQYRNSAPRTVFFGASGGGAGVKRECAGTGVFLPRRYCNNNKTSECRKKPANSTSMLQARMVQALNEKNNNEMNGFVAQTQLGMGFNGGSYMPENDALIARRNALLMSQQRRILRPEIAVNRDIRLPQEWTY